MHDHSARCHHQRCHGMAIWQWPEQHADHHPTSHRKQRQQPCSVTREKAEATPLFALCPAPSSPQAFFFLCLFLLGSSPPSSPRAASRAHHSTPSVPMASSFAFALVLLLFLSSAPFFVFSSEPRNPEGKSLVLCLVPGDPPLLVAVVVSSVTPVELFIVHVTRFFSVQLFIVHLRNLFVFFILPSCVSLRNLA